MSIYYYVALIDKMLNILGYYRKLWQENVCTPFDTDFTKKLTLLLAACVASNKFYVNVTLDKLLEPYGFSSVTNNIRVHFFYSVRVHY